MRTALFTILVLVAVAVPARAQAPLGGCSVWNTNSHEMESVNENHYRLIRNVQVDCNEMQFFADEADIFRDADRVNARGNVTFVSGENRIHADRMEFNTRTRTGTFYVASGIASMANRVDRSMFGTQEPDAYFWGDTIEKIGTDKYRIRRGGFTTCVQPTPRWELVSGSVTLTLEKHALLKNTLLMVKGVPLFYLPVMYYPINKEDRSSGFLLPIYGTSTVRGQTISNAFFWAINRSQDATFYHDYFSKTGQGVAGEYRYVQAPGSQGNFRTNYIAEHNASYTQPDGSEKETNGQSSYSITGSLTQRLPSNWRATGTVNYFSSVTAQQRYQQNVFQATQRQRSYNGSVSGNWSKYALVGTVDRNETFFSETSSQAYGAAPRVTVSRAENPIGGLPLYFGAQGEYVTIQNVRKGDDGTSVDSGLTRMDFLPTLRFPFARWQFLTFNSAASWRATYWTESQLANGARLPDPIGRRYFDVSTRITGPVLTKIFNTPASGYAQKYKHVVEPTISFQRITGVENFDRIPKIDATDNVTGSVTRITYGLNNRLYAKKDTAREILSVALRQTYYSDPAAAARDIAYQSSANPNLPPTRLSPVNAQVHVTPTPRVDVTFNTEYDTQAHALRTLAANGSWSGGWVQMFGGWSQRRFIPRLSGFDNPNLANNYLNTSTTVRKPGNALGGTHTMNYDLRLHRFLQQRYTVFYNSQCCGVGVEYQTFSYGSVIANTIGVPQDRRFNISFTLAGIGSFSNVLGAFGGAQGR